ncbi:MAG: Hsp20/alpha crystallin family protein [Leptospira sp.]|nr:Hsp20/alpha crystallin family protein [Leptospira sp.]
MNTLIKDNESNVSTEQLENNKSEVGKPIKTYSPNVDIFETPTELRFRVEMPGVERKDVQITMEKDQLTIEGKFSFEMGDGGKIQWSEFKEGSYLRKFTIGKAVDSELAKASVNNGILDLVLPKIEPKKTKIQIQ